MVNNFQKEEINFQNSGRLENSNSKISKDNLLNVLVNNFGVDDIKQKFKFL